MYQKWLFILGGGGGKERKKGGKKKKTPNILGLRVTPAQKISHPGNNFIHRTEAQQDIQ
jgi:hypothetical protein